MYKDDEEDDFDIDFDDEYKDNILRIWFYRSFMA